jgi:DNA-binding response OmpR family regulator
VCLNSGRHNLEGITMKRKKILLVDDAGTILMMEQMILNNKYEIVTAKDGQEAIRVALAERPDLILLDVMMPKMDGFEACKQIRANEEIGTTPIIMVTTRAEEKNMELGYQSGCNDFIAKPFNKMEMVSKIKNFLGE